MPLNYDQALNCVFPAVEHSYTSRDSMLYALSVGFGRNPVDIHDLPYVFERALRAAPTMAVVLGVTSIKEANLGIDFTRVVHGEHRLVMHAPIPPAGTVICTSRVTEVVDRGQGKGAIVFIERSLHSKVSSELLATSTMAAFCRGDGGFGGPVTTAPPPPRIPERQADDVQIIAPPANAALLYRLSGDMNPLHADPGLAAKAGFERPILHGLQMFGEVGRLVLHRFAGGNPIRFKSLSCRFTGTVYPGDRLQVHFWESGSTANFRVLAEGRDLAVIDNGEALVAAQGAASCP